MQGSTSQIWDCRTWCFCCSFRKHVICLWSHAHPGARRGVTHNVREPKLLQSPAVVKSLFCSNSPGTAPRQVNRIFPYTCRRNRNRASPLPKPFSGAPCLLALLIYDLFKCASHCLCHCGRQWRRWWHRRRGLTVL